jgi:hypothetical protein
MYQYFVWGGGEEYLKIVDVRNIFSGKARIKLEINLPTLFITVRP